MQTNLFTTPWILLRQCRFFMCAVQLSSSTPQLSSYFLLVFFFRLLFETCLLYIYFIDLLSTCALKLLMPLILSFGLDRSLSLSQQTDRLYVFINYYYYLSTLHITRRNERITAFFCVTNRNSSSMEMCMAIDATSERDTWNTIGTVISVYTLNRNVITLSSVVMKHFPIWRSTCCCCCCHCSDVGIHHQSFYIYILAVVIQVRAQQPILASINFMVTVAVSPSVWRFSRSLFLFLSDRQEG